MLRPTSTLAWSVPLLAALPSCHESYGLSGSEAVGVVAPAPVGSTCLCTGAADATCRVDRDCDAGTRCVEHADGARRPEVPCLSSTMACPSMHACQGSASGCGCEWLGE